MMKRIVICYLLFSMSLMGLGGVKAFAQGKITFDWEDKAQADKWVAVDEQDLGDKGPSSWIVTKGPIDGNALSQASNIWGNAADQVAIGTFYIYDAQTFVNFKLDVDVLAQDNDGMGVVWAYKSPEEHYRVFMMLDAGNPPNGESGPWRKMEKRLGPGAGAKFPFYDEKPLDIDKGNAYEENVEMHWTLDVDNGNFVFSMDGKDVLSASDDTYKEGKIGFQLYAQSGVFFDNIVIEDRGLAVSPKGRLATSWGSIKLRHE